MPFPARELLVLFSGDDLTIFKNRGCGLSATPLKMGFQRHCLFFELNMETQYFKEQAQRVRDLAEKADAFTKKRLLALADHYDARALESSRPVRLIKPLTPVPAATFKKPM